MVHALAREPGDKIVLTESMAGISAVAYFINGVNLVVKAAGLIGAGWILAPASQQQAWIFENSVAGLLDTSTYLGFA